MPPSRTPARGEVRMCGKAEEVHHNNTPQHSATCYKTLVHLHLLFPASLPSALTALASWLLGTPTQFFVLLISPNSIATNRPIRQLSACRRVPTTVTIATLQVLGAHHHTRLLYHYRETTPIALPDFALDCLWLWPVPVTSSLFRLNFSPASSNTWENIARMCLPAGW